MKITKVTVSAGGSYTLAVKLGVASAAQTVEVTADSLTLDTVTDEQSTVIPEVVVQNLPNSGRDFTQMLAQTAGFAGLSTGGGAGMASVNGTRSNSVNWQIEGTDNNDLWWNIPAVNQGGVSALAGVILPIDAIDNFSFVTAGSTEIGRNSGGTANLTIKGVPTPCTVLPTTSITTKLSRPPTLSRLPSLPPATSTTDSQWALQSGGTSRFSSSRGSTKRSSSVPGPAPLSPRRLIRLKR